jgi:hypothetical protein
MRAGSILIFFAAVTLLATAFGTRFYSRSLSSVLLTLVLIARSEYKDSQHNGRQQADDTNLAKDGYMLHSYAPFERITNIVGRIVHAA